VATQSFRRVRRFAGLLQEAGLRGALSVVAERLTVGWDRRAGRRFDRRYGLDTAGRIPLGALGIQSPNRVHGVPYEAVTPAYFERMLASVELPPDTHVFVDLGSGKGRALLLAAEKRSFKRIVGVEFSPVLNAVAASNIERYLAATGKPDIFELHQEDAVAFTFPDEPLALFLYNPFTEPVLRQVIDNLTVSLEQHPRDLVIYYRTPRQASLFDAVDYLRPVSSHYGYRVYRHADWA
jgi:hypothetical protein